MPKASKQPTTSPKFICGPGGRAAGERYDAGGGSILAAAGFRACVQCGRNGSAPVPPPKRRPGGGQQPSFFGLAAVDLKQVWESDGEG